MKSPLFSRLTTHVILITQTGSDVPELTQCLPLFLPGIAHKIGDAYCEVIARVIRFRQISAFRPDFKLTPETLLIKKFSKCLRRLVRVQRAAGDFFRVEIIFLGFHCILGKTKSVLMQEVFNFSKRPVTQLPVT